MTVLKARPAYKGERADRTSKEKVMHMCRRCDRLATHRAQKLVNNGTTSVPLDVYYCEFHLSEATKYEDVRRVRALPEFRRFSARMERWKAQADAGEQGQLL